jgi:hypothetical protein
VFDVPVFVKVGDTFNAVKVCAVAPAQFIVGLI